MNDEPNSQAELSRRSLEERDNFWCKQAARINWETPFSKACDFSAPPFVKWFCGGTTNLCYNAVDRHLANRAGQVAIRFLSSETGEERTLSYRELHREVNVMAAVLVNLGLKKGDRVVLYLPMIPEAAVAMLACVRLGLIHSTVFAGFAAESLARRIVDAEAKLVITCDAGLRNQKIVPLKKTTDAALNLTKGDTRVLVIDRGLDSTAAHDPERDTDYFQVAKAHAGAEVPCVWLESSETSYILYTSGTTARPKGVQRDTGGYAVALAASMEHIFGGQPGETFFCTADVGWVVGHSYTVYGPLIHGMSTVMYEGLPVCPDAGIWWKIAEETQATVMFSSPTAMRVLKKHDPAIIALYDLSRLRTIFLAGEPLDEPTWTWIHHALPHVQIVDNYWQTESGWPILASLPTGGNLRTKPGSPGFPVYGYDAFIADEHTGEPAPRGEKGVLAIRLPLPPGCLSTIWKNDALFAEQYCGQFPGKLLYSTFDYATQDEEGFFFVLGRMDDVINVAGHRIGTREIEEAICTHPAVAEAAAVGAADELKWQVVKCFVVLKYPEHYGTEGARAAVIGEIERSVITELGALARPAFIGLVRQLPKTRSGKVMRRAILAIAESRDPGDLSTLDDPQALEQIRESHAQAAALK